MAAPHRTIGIFSSRKTRATFHRSTKVKGGRTSSWVPSLVETPVTHRVTIRHRDGVTPKMRLKFGARILNIRAVINPAERNRTLELLCEEGVGT